jgi:hypothetical protein
MKWVWRSLLLGLVIAGSVWLWLTLYPSPEKVIRDRLGQLARQATFTPGESDLVQLGKISGLTGFFTDEVEVKLNFRDRAQHGSLTHEMIQAGAATARQQFPHGFKIEFLDPVVVLSAARDQATVELTMKATVPGDKNLDVQEMKFALRKKDDRWLIYAAETVKTLK